MQRPEQRKKISRPYSFTGNQMPRAVPKLDIDTEHIQKIILRTEDHNRWLQEQELWKEKELEEKLKKQPRYISTSRQRKRREEKEKSPVSRKEVGTASIEDIDAFDFERQRALNAQRKLDLKSGRLETALDTTPASSILFRDEECSEDSGQAWGHEGFQLLDAEHEWGHDGFDRDSLRPAGVPMKVFDISSDDEPPSRHTSRKRPKAKKDKKRRSPRRRSSLAKESEGDSESVVRGRPVHKPPPTRLDSPAGAGASASDDEPVFPFSPL